MKSYTSARVYVGVPNATSLDQPALDAAYAGIAAANVRWVRITLPWNSVQPTASPSYTWTAADRAVNRALAAGLGVQLVLAGPRPTGVAAVTPPAFTPFVQAAAQRYRPLGAGITVPGGFVAEYQVWNEPNVDANWVTGSSVSAAQYTAVLKAAYAAIKASHPGAVVVMAGLQACATTTTGPSSRRVTTRQEPVAFLNAMYAAGATGSFDVAAYHPLTLPTSQFPRPPAPSGLTMRQADAFYAALRAKEPTKKVYWTEVGYSSGPSGVTNAQQAAYLDTVRWLAEDRRAWVAGLGLASWRDHAS